MSTFDLRRVDLAVSSVVEMERLMTELHELADSSGESFEVRRRFSVGRNAPCPCNSERKYKKCCAGTDETTVVVRPKGWKPEKRRRSAVPVVGMLTGLLGWAGLGGGRGR